MTDTTKKLSGPAKDRFFKTLLADDEGIDEATAGRLSARAASIVTSLRARQSGLAALERRSARRRTAGPKPAAAEPVPETVAAPMSAPTPPASAVQPAIEAAAMPSSTPRPDDSEAPFDPFLFGLVPVYKREGADGLIVKLAEVGSADHLRAMAKSQQIVLPRELRTGPIDLVQLRLAILEAVEKRVSDRSASL
ncbi:MAG: hypothetical protein NW217_15710 [Hyphomicrobiaceae bacterium]|nr:hypothetical protein [Hyphomicrobiaceae bacterium]